jgi:hypothetical protein
MLKFLSRLFNTVANSSEVSAADLAQLNRQNERDKRSIKLSGIQRKASLIIALPKSEALSVCKLTAEDLNMTVITDSDGQLICIEENAIARTELPGLTFRVGGSQNDSYQTEINITGYSVQSEPIHLSLLKRKLDIFRARLEALASKRQRAVWAVRLAGKHEG